MNINLTVTLLKSKFKYFFSQQFLYNIFSNFKKAGTGKNATMAWYREFVYLLGGVAREGKASIPGDIIAKVVSYHGKPGLGDCFRYRVRNISEGLAIGSYRFISNFQKQCQRKFIRPRSFLSGNCNPDFSLALILWHIL